MPKHETLGGRRARRLVPELDQAEEVLSFQTLVPIRGGTWTLTYGNRWNVDGDGAEQLVIEVWRARAATVALKADGDDSDLASRMVVDGWARRRPPPIPI